MKLFISKIFFSLALVAVLAAGMLLVPVEATAGQCNSTFLGCSFSHIEVHNDGVCDVGCCTYQCPDGSYIQGLCFYL